VELTSDQRAFLYINDLKVTTVTNQYQAVITEVIRKVQNGNLYIQAITSTLQKFTATPQSLPFQKFTIISDI
jgi:hypothetical protein